MASTYGALEAQRDDERAGPASRSRSVHVAFLAGVAVSAAVGSMSSALQKSRLGGAASALFSGRDRAASSSAAADDVDNHVLAGLKCADPDISAADEAACRHYYHLAIEGYASATALGTASPNYTDTGSSFYCCGDECMFNWHCMNWFCQCVPTDTAQASDAASVCGEDSLLFGYAQDSLYVDELTRDDMLSTGSVGHTSCDCEAGAWAFADVPGAACVCPSSTWVGVPDLDDDDADDDYDDWLDIDFNPGDSTKTSVWFCPVGYTLKCTTLFTGPLFSPCPQNVAQILNMTATISPQNIHGPWMTAPGENVGEKCGASSGPVR